MNTQKAATPTKVEALRRLGRPKTNPLPRTEQLRIAKRAQRLREADAGLAPCQVTLTKNVAAKLRQAIALPGFEQELERFLGDAVIDIRKFPNLKLLCWNRAVTFVTASDAFDLYECNWRFVDQDAMEEGERALIERLARDYGAGVLNV